MIIYPIYLNPCLCTSFVVQYKKKGFTLGCSVVKVWVYWFTNVHPIFGSSACSCLNDSVFVHSRIDATADDGAYGRLINDDHLTPNLSVRLIQIKGEYMPAFFASRNIPSGEEIVYNYGGGEYAWREVSWSCIVHLKKLFTKY